MTGRKTHARFVDQLHETERNSEQTESLRQQGEGDQS
jgi:hypothetical protein